MKLVRRGDPEGCQPDLLGGRAIPEGQDPEAPSSLIKVFFTKVGEEFIPKSNSPR